MGKRWKDSSELRTWNSYLLLFIIVGQIFLFLVFEFSAFLIMYQRKL